MATVSIAGVLADVDQTTHVDASHPADGYVLELHDRIVRVVVPAFAVGTASAFIGERVRVYCPRRSSDDTGAGLQWVADLAVRLVVGH